MIFLMDVKYLGFSCNNGEINMRLDEHMLKEAIENGYDFALLRFYTWKPKCVSLGKNQKTPSADLPSGVDVVRRITGGRALLHDKELTYSIVAPILEGDGVLDSYRHVSDGLVAGFKKLGLEVECSSNKGSNAAYCMEISCGADISYKGRKLVGSAQFRSRGYFLQHGSILLDIDFELLEEIFSKKIDKNSIATLREIGANITLEELENKLRCGIEEHFRHKYNIRGSLQALRGGKHPSAKESVRKTKSVRTQKQRKNT